MNKILKKTKSQISNEYYSNDELNHRIFTYKDGKYNSQDIVDYNLIELSKEYEIQIITTILYYKSCDKSELFEYFKNKMFKYMESMARSHKTSINNIFNQYYNPSSDEGEGKFNEYINKLLIYDIIEEDLGKIYRLSDRDGRSFAEYYFKEKYKNDWKILNVFRNRKFESSDILDIMIDYFNYETQNKIPDLLFFIGNQNPIPLNDIYKRYISYKMRKNISRDPEKIKNEVLKSLQELDNLNLIIKYNTDENNIFFMLNENGSNVLDNSKYSTHSILDNLRNDFFINIDEDKNIVYINNNGKKIINEILLNFFNDKTKLENIKPTPKNVYERSAPIHIQYKQDKRMLYMKKTNYVNRLNSYDGWKQKIVKMTRNKKNALNLLMGLGLILIMAGLALFSVEMNSEGQIFVLGGFSFVMINVIITILNNKWNSDEYYYNLSLKKQY